MLATISDLTCRKNRRLNGTVALIYDGLMDISVVCWLCGGGVEQSLENGGAKVGHGSGGMSLLRAA